MKISLKKKEQSYSNHKTALSIFGAGKLPTCEHAERISSTRPIVASFKYSGDSRHQCPHSNINNTYRSSRTLVFFKIGVLKIPLNSTSLKKRL